MVDAYLCGYNEKAFAFFLDNPYCILGIPSNASYSNASDALEKIKRLDRIEAALAYKTPYELLGFDLVPRDIAICQNALARLKELSHKWFWFDTAEACKNWQSVRRVSRLSLKEIAGSTYDTFLKQYLYVLAFDEDFTEAARWYEIFGFYWYIAGKGHAEQLRAKLNEAEKKEYRDSTIIENFEDNIFKPLELILDDAGIEELFNFYKIVQNCMQWSGICLMRYSGNLARRITGWFVGQEKILWKKIESYIELESLDADAVDKLWEAAQEYDELVSPRVEDALTRLKKRILQVDIIQSSYLKVMRQLMVLFLRGQDMDKAVKCARRLYGYEDEERKNKIAAAFGFQLVLEMMSDTLKVMEGLWEGANDADGALEDEIELADGFGEEVDDEFEEEFDDEFELPDSI